MVAPAVPATPAAAPVVPVGPAIARDIGATFQTDSVGYTLRAGTSGYEGQIGVVFTNRTPGAVYIVNCGGATQLRLEKLVGGEWKYAWAPYIPLCLSPPITVAPGETYRTGIRVFGGYAGSKTYPQFEVGDIAGVYRAVWLNVLSSYQDRAPFGEVLPTELRVSNRFTLLIEPR
jgi:hypothetical protein